MSARWINDNGGVDGHRWSTVGDDGGDPVRHRALVQEFVEQRKVIAFVGNPEALTGAGSVEYLTKAGIPVVGSEGAGQWFYESPVYFPGPHGGLAGAGGRIPSGGAQRAQGHHQGRVDQLCRGPGLSRCETIGAAVREHGMEVVYSASASLAQPDFTAECLNARNAGAQIISMGMDPNAIRTIAQACPPRRTGRSSAGPGSKVASHATDPTWRARRSPACAGVARQHTPARVSSKRR